MYLSSGTTLNNRYVIENVLGHGGFGITYAAHDILLKVKVAIKEYLPRQLATRGEGRTKVSIFTGEARQQYDYGLRKFLEEAQSVARFAHHPNVVSARDYFEANGTAYMVMEYVEGVTLKEYLQKKGGRISFEEAKSIMMPVMDALREVHQAGMLHRDISPDNIYITTSAQVKILDFGAARYFAGEQSKSLSVILKPGYAPEEQYRSSGKQGSWTDVYSVGATFYKALTGQTPPDALDRKEEDTLAPPSRLGVAMPPAAEQTLLKALAVNPDQRFQTLGEFQDHLTGAGGPGITIMVPKPAPTPLPAPSGSSRPRKKGRWAAVLVVSGLIGIVLAGGLLWRASIISLPALLASKVAEVKEPSGVKPSSPQPVPPETRASQDFSVTQQEFSKKWLLDWQFQQSFKGYMIITGQSGETNYSGKLFTKSGRSQVVSLDVTIAINGDRVFIHGSNPNVPGWNTDDFFLELKGSVMSGYSTDKTGRRGKALFQGVNETQFEAYLQKEFSPAALMVKPPESPQPAASSAPGDIQQVIGQYYGRVQSRDVAGAVNLYASAKIPVIKRNLIATVAKETEYYRIESINVAENNGVNAKAQVHLFHKKFNRPEEKWYIEISLLKEFGEWRIVTTPGKKLY